MARSASFGMYDGPALHEANDTLWELIAERLSAAGVSDIPSALDRQRPLDAIFGDPDLLLAQCCGYPLVTRYRDRLRYVATPRYAAPGCSGASYRSRIVVRAEDPAERLADLRGRRAAVNEWVSNSGMNLFRGAIASVADGARFFEAVAETGSHAASVRAVAAGEADVAAIDCITFEHLVRSGPDVVAQLRTIGWTEASPGLPYVTSVTAPDELVELLRRVIGEVMQSAAPQPARSLLLIDGTDVLPADAYDCLLHVEGEAARLHYPILA